MKHYEYIVSNPQPAARPENSVSSGLPCSSCFRRLRTSFRRVTWMGSVHLIFDQTSGEGVDATLRLAGHGEERCAGLFWSSNASLGRKTR